MSDGSAKRRQLNIKAKQKLLEKLYRESTGKPAQTTTQKSLNRLYSKKYGPNGAKKNFGSVSKKVLNQSKARVQRQAIKQNTAKAISSGKTSLKAAKVATAKNISKFGKGTLGKFGSTLATSKFLQFKAGAKLTKLAVAVKGSSFLAGANSVPALALAVGAYAIWKHNIGLIYRINGSLAPWERQGRIPPSTTRSEELPFYGGQEHTLYYVTLSTIFRGKEYIQTVSPAVWGSIKSIDWAASGTDKSEVVVTAGTETDPREVSTRSGARTGNRKIPFDSFSVVSIERIDGLPDTGGNIDGSGKGYPSGDTIINNYYITQAPSTPLDTASKTSKNPTPKRKTNPPKSDRNHSDADIELKTTSVPTPVPVPQVQPGDNVDTEPAKPQDSPVVKTKDTTVPTERKKPSPPRYTKTQKYPTYEESQAIRDVIERERQKRDIKITGFGSISGDLEDRGQFQKRRNKSLEEAAIKAGFDTDAVPSSKISSSPGVTKITTKVAEPDTQTEDNKIPDFYFPRLVETDPNPSNNPKATKVNPCKKGCGGGGSPSFTPGSPESGNMTGLLNDLFLQNPLLRKIDETTTATRGVVTNPNFGLQKVQEYASTAWKATRADKILNGITTALVVHNAVMLSANLGQTIGDVASVAMNAIGIRDEEDNPIDVNGIVRRKLDAMIVRFIGEEKYAALTQKLASSMRIYQSAVNVLDITRSMFDSVTSMTELTVEHTGKIGNALLEARVVYEDAYEEMVDTVNPHSKALTKVAKFGEAVNTVEDAFDSIGNVASEVVDVKDTYAELAESKQEFFDVIKEEKENLAEATQETKTDSQVTTEIDTVDFEADPLDGQ